MTIRSVSRKIIASVAALGAAITVGGWATYAAFSHTTQNAGNNLDIGNVRISDNDTAAMFNILDPSGGNTLSAHNMRPDDPEVRCIRVTYDGSLDADVKLYGAPAASLHAQANLMNLVIEAGTASSPAFGDCSSPGTFTEFAAAGSYAAGHVYSGDLAHFMANHGSWADGIVVHRDTTTDPWQSTNSVVYRFTMTVADDNAANLNAKWQTGEHTFTWEAQNTLP